MHKPRQFHPLMRAREAECLEVLLNEKTDKVSRSRRREELAMYQRYRHTPRPIRFSGVREAPAVAASNA